MVQNLSGNGDANSSQIDDEMTKLFEEEIAKMPSLRRGEAIEGKVLLIDEEGVLVNIGAKSEGMIPHREIRTLGDDNVEALKAGDTIITVMIRQDELRLKEVGENSRKKWKLVILLQQKLLGSIEGGFL